ncbi:MAG: hypothetical protein ABI459_07470 [Deltaproteobacteria bacterium]
MRRLILVIAALTCLLSLSGCGKVVSWKQKLTLIIETPAGEVTGHSVVAISARYFRETIGNEVEYDVTGEAVVVEVLPGKYLFALLGEPSEAYYWAARERFPSKKRGDWLFEIPQQTEPVNLFPDHIPMLVTFDDINDPASVKLVDPLDLAASFGPGVSLKTVTVQVTDEPVTEGKVEEVLGWWLTMRSGPYNEMTPLRLSDDSPRGWDDLGALQFWSLDKLKEFSERKQ